MAGKSNPYACIVGEVLSKISAVEYTLRGGTGKEFRFYGLARKGRQQLAGLEMPPEEFPAILNAASTGLHALAYQTWKAEMDGISEAIHAMYEHNMATTDDFCSAAGETGCALQIVREVRVDL